MVFAIVQILYLLFVNLRKCLIIGGKEFCKFVSGKKGKGKPNQTGKSQFPANVCGGFQRSVH